MEYYLVLKRNDFLTNGTTWMNLEDILLSEMSESENTNTVFLNPLNFITGKFIVTESRMVVARDRGAIWDVMSYCLMGTVSDQRLCLTKL